MQDAEGRRRARGEMSECYGERGREKDGLEMRWVNNRLRAERREGGQLFSRPAMEEARGELYSLVVLEHKRHTYRRVMY